MPTATKPGATKAPAKKAAPKPQQVEKRERLVWFIGNFAPPHSTENHVARALRSRVGRVEEVQESDPTCWGKLRTTLANGERPDFILWTRTGWDWANLGADPQAMQIAQFDFLLAAERAGVPVVGYHLDIWWGLQRERQVFTEPFFRSTLLITADGGHQEQFEAAGVNHVWFPPAVSAVEAVEGHPIEQYQSPLAFVGSHDGGYHQEHQHRHELIGWLRTNFRNSCRFFPEPGQPGIRGQDLQDLYASVDVVVGDSCFAGTDLPNYWSDRIPETLGRGGLLVHPYVPGLENHFNLIRYDDPSTWAGGNLVVWDAGNWDQLRETIQWLVSLNNVTERKLIAQAGRAHVLAHHTYEIRMQQLMELLIERGLIR